MISGGRKKDRLWLNDTTLWSGYPKDQDNPESLKHIGKVRELIFAGRNKEAQNLAEQYLTGGYSESYLPLGQMTISLTGMGGNYSRELDIKRAIHTIKTDSAVRTAFISYPDKVAVYRIENTEKFNVKISLFSQMSYTASSNGGGLEMSGEAPDYVVPNYLRTEKKPIRYNEGRGMCWAVRAEVVTDGNVSYSGTKMAVNGAKTLTIYMVTATGFKAYNEMPATDSSYALDKCRSALKALEKNYDGILKRHIEDYSALYNKQSVNLNEESELPTDKLLKKTKKSGKASLALINLLYNYGKYLTIAGSRKGGQALNLQGLWNKSMRPPWSSNYTVNIILINKISPRDS
jgi:alpha-L-fucosidase 2